MMLHAMLIGTDYGQTVTGSHVYNSRVQVRTDACKALTAQTVHRLTCEGDKASGEARWSVLMRVGSVRPPIELTFQRPLPDNLMTCLMVRAHVRVFMHVHASCAAEYHMRCGCSVKPLCSAPQLRPESGVTL